MELNQTTLRLILAQILSVDKKCVVPKQGNWWNPQEKQGNISNWCAFQIKSNKPRTVPFYYEQSTNKASVEKIATIDLQFVGPDSEDIANSVALWPLRADVKEQFETVQGALLNNGMEAISSIFYQDGNNDVMAWNVQIQVLWISQMETGQGKMPGLTLNGTI